MKKSIPARTFFIVLSLLILTLTACKKDDPVPTEQERVNEILTSERWDSPLVTVDGVDHSDVYKDFQIKFNDNTYTSTAGSPLWRSSGTWKFTNEEATVMKLDDTQEVEVKILPDDFIELTLQWDQDTFTPGRISSVKGKQKFKLKKKKS